MPKGQKAESLVETCMLVVLENLSEICTSRTEAENISLG